MKRLEVHAAIKTPVVFSLLVLTAFFTPWWGTVIVVAVLSVLIGISARGIALLTFFAWASACVLRDLANQFGPSRVFARLFQLDQIGFAVDAIQSRIVVYVLVSLAGFLLAFFAAGFLKSVRSFFPSVTLR